MQEQHYLKIIDSLQEKAVVLYLSDEKLGKVTTNTYNLLESSLSDFYGEGFSKKKIKSVSSRRKFIDLSHSLNDVNKSVLIGEILSGLSDDKVGLKSVTKIYKNNGDIISVKKARLAKIEKVIKEISTHL